LIVGELLVASFLPAALTFGLTFEQRLAIIYFLLIILIFDYLILINVVPWQLGQGGKVSVWSSRTTLCPQLVHW